MPTPTQYQLLNTLLEAPRHAWFARLSAEQQRDLTHLADMVRHDIPIVDCTDVWRAMLDNDDRFDRDVFTALMRPYRTGALHMPWPVAVLTCAFTPANATLWAVSADKSSLYGIKFGAMTLAIAGGKVGPSPYGAGTSHTPESLATLAVLAIANAKNASWVESAPNRATRRRQPLVASVRFRHIDIDMSKPRALRNAQASGVEALTPWHHRRGHWAFYGENKPLFGRRGEFGWYWRPYVEVGNKAHGTIVQSYSVRATGISTAPAMQVAA